MRTVKLNKATIKDLDNKKPDICYLLENDLATINSCNELFETLENECSIDIYDEAKASEYLGNKGYKIIYEEDTINNMIDDLFKSYMNKNKIKHLKENINNYTEEEQIKIFNEHKKKQKIIMYQLLDALEQLDKKMIVEGLKEYEFIK